MDGCAARLKSTVPVVTLGEAQRLLAHLARCLNDVVAPPPDGKWPEEQRATMRYYFTAVLEELEGQIERIGARVAALPVEGPVKAGLPPPLHMQLDVASGMFRSVQFIR